MSENTTEPRSLLDICREIQETWVNAKTGQTQIRPDGPGFGAVPYFEAMFSMARWGTEGPNDMYGADDLRGIVIYFLSNASSFRGETAKRIKAELKRKYNIK